MGPATARRGSVNRRSWPGQRGIDSRIVSGGRTLFRFWPDSQRYAGRVTLDLGDENIHGNARISSNGSEFSRVWTGSALGVASRVGAVGIEGQPPGGRLSCALPSYPGVIMGVIAWIVLGIIAGAIAEHLISRRESHGIIITCLIGIAGALLGGWLATKLFHVHSLQGFFNLSTWITALAGATLLLGAGHLVEGQRGGRRSVRR